MHSPGIHYVSPLYQEAETQRDFNEAVAGDDYGDGYDRGHDESVCDTFDEHLTYG
jgi:hypothetical protein